MPQGDAPVGAGPTMPGSSAAGGTNAELGVLISAGAGKPDRLILLARPANGKVRLREWSTHNWSSAPEERDLAIADALSIFQGAYDSRRRMSVSLKGIEAWLAGRRA